MATGAEEVELCVEISNWERKQNCWPVHRHRGGLGRARHVLVLILHHDRSPHLQWGPPLFHALFTLACTLAVGESLSSQA